MYAEGVLVLTGIRGKNLAEVKRQNLESIKLILYRRAPLSRVEIAEQLNLTPPTITNIVAELIGQGVAQELASDSNAVNSHGIGRRPINVDLVSDFHYVLGISLGRDFTRYCITDLRGNIRAQGEFELMSDDYTVMIHQLQGILSVLMRRHSYEFGKMLGIGITVPGIVNSHTGVIKNHGTERVSWRNQPLAQTISQFTGLPVRVENNVRARACAISLFQPSLVGDEATFALCHVSWGIACPIVLGNRPFRGEGAAAGEIGKMILAPHAPSSPGFTMPGTLEALASVHAILEQCKPLLSAKENSELKKLCSDPEKLTINHILEAQRKGDPAVCQIMDTSMFYVGIALANIVDIINPHLIFLSGEVFHNPENIESVERSLLKHAFLPDDDPLKLVHASLGDYGGALGASACCIEKYFIRG